MSTTSDDWKSPSSLVYHFARDPSFVNGAPSLAIEYADRGQDQVELSKKVSELLAAGTRWIWVVRLDRELALKHALENHRWLEQVAVATESTGLLRK